SIMACGGPPSVERKPAAALHDLRAVADLLARGDSDAGGKLPAGGAAMPLTAPITVLPLRRNPSLPGQHERRGMTRPVSASRSAIPEGAIQTAERFSGGLSP